MCLQIYLLAEFVLIIPISTEVKVFQGKKELFFCLQQIMPCLNTTSFLERSEQVLLQLLIFFSHSENEEKFDAYSPQHI